MKVQPRLYSIRYDAYSDSISGVEYKKPVKLKKALIDIAHEKALNEGIIGEKNTLQRFILDLSKAGDKILERKVVALKGFGSVAAAFETADGKILKLTDGNHFPMNRMPAGFDVPVYRKGHRGKTYYYLEEKLYQHNLSEDFVQIVKNAIKNSGFRPSDLYAGDVFQIGIAKNGKLYLADPECAKYKTIFHALVDKALKIIRKK